MPALGNSRHLDEEEVLRYSMDEAAEELPRWEEHLLICGSCRSAVAGCDAYVAAMRSAAAALRQAPPQPESRRRKLFPALVRTAAALALLAVCSIVFLPRAGRAPAAFAVRLSTTRGPGLGERAPARTPLLLQPDLTGLPAWPSYGLEVVDRAGKPVWRGSLAASAAARGVSVPPLAPGVYFARIFSPQGELYREYGLEVGAGR